MSLKNFKFVRITKEDHNTSKGMIFTQAQLKRMYNALLLELTTEDEIQEEDLKTLQQLSTQFE